MSAAIRLYSIARSEDVEGRLVLRGRIRLDVGLGLHPLQVLGLDPLADAGAAGRQQPAAGIHGDLDHAFGRLVGSDRPALEGDAHVVDPDGQRGPATILAITERGEVVAANPDGGDDVAAETGEPGVAVLVGRAGLAGDV